MVYHSYLDLIQRVSFNRHLMNNMKKIVIAGGSGFLGSCIATHFANQGYQITILSRSQQLEQKNIHYVLWDAKTKGTWTAELDGIDLLINLTGKSVDCRYTDANKQLIYDSRIDSTNLLGGVVKELKHPPKLWINAASATIYRHALDRAMDEETGDIGKGFSVDVCQKWEHAFETIEAPKTRKVALRIGIVLGRNGGALTPLRNLVKVGLGGQQGNGRQYFSWLHEKDFVGIIDHIKSQEDIIGVYNATSPHPVPNHEVMRMLRREVGIAFGLPMPKWLLTLGAVLIRTETELILKSRRVVPRKLLQSGYQFQFEHIESALIDLMKSDK